MKNKVLILGNPLNHEGGMVEFNKGIISTINSRDETFKLESFSIGSKMALFYYPVLKRIVYPFIFIFDLLRLSLKLFDKEVKIIQLNPSLIPVPIIRDGIVLLINKVLFKKKTVIVLHGWKEYIYTYIIRNKALTFFTKIFFNSANEIFVLSKDFKDKLIAIEVVESRIKLTTTFFYKDDIKSFVLKENKGKAIKFVFLGRVSKIKGIGELIDAFDLVKNKMSNFVCEIIGHGDKPGTLKTYEEYVKSKGLSNYIKFLGRKINDDKFLQLSKADIFVFPSYMEGCPTSVIEALALGLYIVSSDVGALNDIINSNNGITVKPKDSKGLAKAIVYTIKEIEYLRNFRKSIADEAMKNFEVNQVANQFCKTYSNLISI
tara:strand:- start:432 stop:1556 length:1125 start_codon:yes stop_codon:yes gene_type:complete